MSFISWVMIEISTLPFYIRNHYVINHDLKNQKLYNHSVKVPYYCVKENNKTQKEVPVGTILWSLHFLIFSITTTNPWLYFCCDLNKRVWKASLFFIFYFLFSLISSNISFLPINNTFSRGSSHLCSLLCLFPLLIPFLLINFSAVLSS